MSDATYVVIGGGLAGAKAVEALRDEEIDGRVIMIGEEPELPYERPELSKGYLAGKTDRGALTVHEDGWYARHDVELLLGRKALAIDAGARTVRLDESERVGYDRLLLATGSRPRRLDVPGADLDGVLYLRKARDADAIRTALATKEPVVVVGGGWIALEVAAVARQSGLDVTVVSSAPSPMFRVLGAEVGARFADLHRDHGVKLCLNRHVVRIHGEDQATAVELDDGTRLAAGAVIIGIGAEPMTELAATAGLDTVNGVPVDGTLRTEDPRIWAAGDLAFAENTWVGSPLRVDHFANAEQQGTFAGRSMAGAIETWGAAPFFWSDQYDAGLEYRGWADPQKTQVVFRDVADGQWAAFWLSDGRVSAGLHVNLWDDAKAVKDLVLDRAEVDVGRLSDAEVDWPDTRT